MSSHGMPIMSYIRKKAELEVLIKALNLNKEKYYDCKFLYVKGSKISFKDSMVCLSEYEAQVQQSMIKKADYPYEKEYGRYTIELVTHEHKSYPDKDVMIAEDNLSEPLDDSLVVDRILDERKKLGLLDPRS